MCHTVADTKEHVGSDLFLNDVSASLVEHHFSFYCSTLTRVYVHIN